MAARRLPAGMSRQHRRAHWTPRCGRICAGYTLLALLILLAGCASPPPLAAESGPLEVTLRVDGESHNVTTTATNVRELLEEAGITTAPADEVNPPPFTPLQDRMEVVVVRIEESVEIVEESLPFARKIVRSAALADDAPPQIVQAGRAGLQEITVRLVFRDGIEVERQRTQITVVQEPQDEIVMIGVGTAAGDFAFPGLIAYLSGGQAVLLPGSTDYHQQLPTGGNLDGRVFALSPTGSHLLYTRIVSDTGHFNNKLFVLATEPGAEPRDLDVENVLWAGWNPAREGVLQIAYSTAEAVDVPPGWQANNDLWVATIPATGDLPISPSRVVVTYPATYGWWGGTYAWSPGGRYVAFAYADEIGLFDLEARNEDERAIVVYTFPEYDTRADWVWLPTLSWSPDGNFLVASTHGGASPEDMVFDIWVVNASGGLSGRFVEQAGMWSHPHWSPPDDSPRAGSGGSQIAFLQANNPLDGLRSAYSLWLMDADGSNTRRIYPEVGENSAFPREAQFMQWGPSGRDIAFIFDDALYLLDVDSGSAYRVTQDDAVASRPTWAPYGAAINTAGAGSRLTPVEPGETGSGDEKLPRYEQP
jgi:resuscitation-promoting factor RpfB